MGHLVIRLDLVVKAPTANQINILLRKEMGAREAR